jgi:hypothetical protein
MAKVNSLSTQEALAALNSLSPNSYREGEVSILCQTLQENITVIEAARVALRNGYVKSVFEATKLGNLHVIITFRRPPAPG